jgi:hypothetical protein
LRIRSQLRFLFVCGFQACGPPWET